jgi:hypothetical protein
VLADIDKDGDLEVCFGAEEIYVLHHDGSELVDGDNDVTTHGVFSDVRSTVSKGFWSSPAIGDVDNDGVIEIVANHMDGNKTYVWKSNGDVMPGWPKYVGQFAWSSPAIGDIDGDTDLEIVTGSGAKNFYAWNPDGTEVIDGDSNPGTNGVFAVLGRSFNYGSPGLADLDGDGISEIVFGGRDGYLYVWRGDGSSYDPAFPKDLIARIVTAPAIADLDGDPQLEIVVAAGDQGTGAAHRKVHVLNLDGTEVPGWPRPAELSKDTGSSPAIGDVDRNGTLDVVVGDADGVLHAWEGATADYLPGWPVQTEAGQSGASSCYIRSGPTIVDIDGDLFVEILFGDEGGRIYAYNHDGTPLAGFPIYNVYVWEYSWGFTPSIETAPWPFFKNNAYRTSLFNQDSLSTVSIIPPGTGGPKRSSVFLEQNFPNPFCFSTSIVFYVPAPRARVSLDVFDPKGRLVRRLVAGSVPSGVHCASWDGRDGQGRASPSGLYFCRLKVGGKSWQKRMVLVK